MQFLQACNNSRGVTQTTPLASAIEYKVQPGKWHSQRVSTSAATSRDKMKRHTPHGDSPCRLRKKFGSTYMNNAHNLYTQYIICVSVCVPVFYGNWSMKWSGLPPLLLVHDWWNCIAHAMKMYDSIMVFSCQESKFIEGLF